MAEAYGLTDSEIEFLKTLVNHRVPFMIVGLAAAAMQGAPVVTQDIDLWFEVLDHPGLKAAIQEFKAAYVPPTFDRPPMFGDPRLARVDIVLTMSGLGKFHEELVNTIPLPVGEWQVRVLNLERIIVSKQAAGREKDRLTLHVLIDALRARRRVGLDHSGGSTNLPEP